MKKIIIMLLVLIFVLASISFALASRYNATSGFGTGGSSSHYGFADTTDKCEDCHAVHLAQGSYKILRPGASTGETACAFCHGTGSPATAKGYITLNTSGHGLGGLSGTINAPDEATPGFQESATAWGCASCHSVHAQGTIRALIDSVSSGSTNRLLKGKPDTRGTDAYSVDRKDQTVSLSLWCSACHGANIGTYGQSTTVQDGPNPTLAYGHTSWTTGITPTVASSLTYAYFRSPGATPQDYTLAPRCNQCHAAGAIKATGANGWVSGQGGRVDTGSTSQPVDFPHSGYWNTYSYSLLKSQAATSADRMDDICNDCHYTPSLP